MPKPATPLPPRPQSAYKSQLGQRAAYQYKSMNRFVPTQVRAWAKASGNPYTLKTWKQASTIPNSNKDYFNNVLMQRFGGDSSLQQRMGSMYYTPQQLPDAWRNAPTWQPGSPDWMKRRLQGDYSAVAPAQTNYGGSGGGGNGWGWKTYTVAQGMNVGKTYNTSLEAILAMLGLSGTSTKALRP